jgi:hypothetical protein
LLLTDAPDLKSAEEKFEKPMALARHNSAFSYQLRAPLQLAQIWIFNGELQRLAI